ncbi:hypothetical protein THASP1DRAFT_29059 [Thamnocephalis sphaerospora]|uniref:Peroxin/Ferlin domain-containing protein n=1 Tax=Thamnocephalis sphaerospora TaxID=78915 RepID=A0A4P9XSP1_9FUNG|nr:hypothetical protein THASP1DRAFT_29059 [Thamnocephalis sphaerospora]|eukprot:RKP09137.1 hypothetical protein THASP1DRAFT_29059 [Thamnocephalis sphaerospora]
MDPPPWSDHNYRFMSPNLASYQLPDPTWEWVHPAWSIDMSGDVDEEGWEYAAQFHNARWHGPFEVFRSFVRRRRWIRLRKRKTTSDLAVGVRDRSRKPSVASTTRSMSTDRQSDWLLEVRRLRIDREKLAVLKSQLQNKSAGAWITQSLLQQFLFTLDYNANRRRAMELIGQLQPELLWKPRADELAFHTDRAEFEVNVSN